MGIISRPERPQPKPLIWMGSAKKDLCALPSGVIDVFGYALYLAQCGKEIKSNVVYEHDQAAALLSC
jgi:phage-related protein